MAYVVHHSIQIIKYYYLFNFFLNYILNFEIRLVTRVLLQLINDDIWVGQDTMTWLVELSDLYIN